MRKIADKCVELVSALKKTYQESSIPKDKPFSALFLDPLDRYVGRDHWDVVAELYGDMSSKSQTQKEQAHIAVACLLADMAFNTYETDADKALDYLCQAYLTSGWAINSTVEPSVIKRARTATSREAANKRHEQGKIVRQHAEHLVRTWTGEPLKNPSRAAKALHLEVNKYAIERFRRATDDENDPFYQKDDPFVNKSDPRKRATGKNKGEDKEPYSVRTLRDWFSELDFTK